MVNLDINQGINVDYKWRLLRAVSRFLKKLPIRKYFVNERLVEHAFVIKNIDSEGKILDVGCVESQLPIELASIGHSVYGIDIRDYPFTHPNFVFGKGDIRKTNFENEFFDYVISLSTIEHIGLDIYGSDFDEHGDSKSVEEIHRILNVGGKFILTIPMGKSSIIKNLERIYDYQSVVKLLNGFEIVKEEFYKIVGMERVEKSNIQELESLEYTTKKDAFSEKTTRGVGLFLCIKR